MLQIREAITKARQHPPIALQDKTRIESMKADGGRGALISRS
jgi:hypothetical protein